MVFVLKVMVKRRQASFHRLPGEIAYVACCPGLCPRAYVYNAGRFGGWRVEIFLMSDAPSPQQGSWNSRKEALAKLVNALEKEGYYLC